MEQLKKKMALKFALGKIQWTINAKSNKPCIRELAPRQDEHDLEHNPTDKCQILRCIFRK